MLNTDVALARLYEYQSHFSAGKDYERIEKLIIEYKRFKKLQGRGKDWDSHSYNR